MEQIYLQCTLRDDGTIWNWGRCLGTVKAEDVVIRNDLLTVLKFNK